MKRLLLLSFALVLTSCSSALKVAYNSVENDKRIVVTSNLPLFSAKSYNFKIAMGAMVSPKDTVLGVLITSDKDTDHGIFDQGNRLLVKLASGENIALSNIYNKEFEENTETVNTTDRVTSYGYEYAYSPFADAIVLAPYEVSTMIPRTYIRKTHNSYALYLITEKQVKDICQNKIIKLRVEIEDKDLDMPTPEYTSDIFKELYNFLSPIVKNGIPRSEF